MVPTLRPLEQEALELIYDRGGMLASCFEERSSQDVVFKNWLPGLSVFRRLEKLGLSFTTEEDLMFPDEPELGTYTPSIELTPEGKAWVEAHRAAKQPDSAPRARKPRA